MRLLAVLLAVASLLPCQTVQARLRIKTTSDRLAVSSLGLDMSERDGVAELFAPSRAALEPLKDAGLGFEVLHDDLETFYASRLLPQPDGPGPVFGQGAMGGIFGLDEMVDFMEDLAQAHPHIMTSKTSLGLTLEGRPIWMWKISDHPQMDEPEPEILVDGGTHAREVMSMQTAVYLAMRLVEGYGTDQELTHLVNEREIFIVPLINGDGFAFNEVNWPQGGGMWRKNRRPNVGGSFGVDLNRNFGHQWGLNNIGSSGNPNDDTYRGQAPFSEPETLAMKTFCEGRSFRLAVNLHGFGNYVLVPPGYAVNAMPPQPLLTGYQTLAGEMALFPPGYVVGYPWAVLGEANGTTLDWCYGSLYGGHQVWSFALEIGSSVDGFWPSTPRIVPVCEEAFEYLRYLLRVAGPDLRISAPGIGEPSGTIPGTWEPGETLTLLGEVHNLAAVSTDITLRIETTSPWLQLPPHLMLGTIQSFGSQSVTSQQLAVTIDPAAPVGADLYFTLVAEAPGSLPARASFTGPIGLTRSLQIFDDFEQDLGWTVGAQGDNATSGLWTRMDPNGTSYAGLLFNPEDDHTPSGSACWFTGQGPVGGPPTIEDVDGITSLVSPAFDLSQLQSPVLSYWRWFATNGNDFLEVAISNDDGATWKTLETVRGLQNQWTPVSFPLEFFRPRSNAMRIKVRCADFPNNSLCEGALDDVLIQGAPPAMSLQGVGSPTIGSHVTLAVSASGWPLGQFVLASALTANAGLPVASGLVPLDFDAVFVLVPFLPQVFEGFAGTLDAQGLGSSTLRIPFEPALQNLQLFTAGAVLSGGNPVALSGSYRIVIQ